MKKYFWMGFAVLLPAVISIICLFFVVNFLTKPFEGMVSQLFFHYGWTAPKELLAPLIKVATLLLLVAFVLTVGIVAQNAIVRRLIHFGERAIHRIPLANSIYGSAKEVVQTLLADGKRHFSQVVLVPFPSAYSYAIGLVASGGNSNEIVSVFIPTTPNPTMGFLVGFEPKDLRTLSISVEEAIQIVISCGHVIPGCLSQPKHFDAEH